MRKWDAVKRAEKPERGDPFEGIPQALPGPGPGQKSLDRAPSGPGCHRCRLTLQPGASVVGSPNLASEDELGELLLAVVGAARTRDFDAERALRGAVRRYQDSHAVSRSRRTDHDVRVLDRFP